MTEIKLFGASTLAGCYLKNNYKKYLKQSKIASFSRTNSKDIFFDLKSSIYPKELMIRDETLIISLAPLWKIVPFLKKYLSKINQKQIKGIIVTSSTSIETKKYSLLTKSSILSLSYTFIWQPKVFI